MVAVPPKGVAVGSAQRLRTTRDSFWRGGGRQETGWNEEC
jgi:hypothetical protein